MKRYIGIAILVIVAGAAALWAYTAHAPAPGALAQYASPDTKLSFSYPKKYGLTSRADGYRGTDITVINLIDSAAAENIPDQSEGPPGMSVIAIPTTTPDIAQWVQANSISNFFLSQDKRLASTTIGGEPAVAYEHSGLYENDAAAVAHGGYVYVFSADWLAANDQARADFQNLLRSVEFTQ